MKIRRILTVVLLGLFVLLIAPQLVGLENSVLLLKQVDFWFIPLMTLALGLSYFGVAQLTRTILGYISYKLELKSIFRLALINVFAIHLLPVGTLGGATLDWWFLKKKNYKSSQILLMFVLRTIYLYAAFGVIFMLTGFFISTSNLSKNDSIAIYVTVILALMAFVYVIYIYKQKEIYFKRFGQLFTGLNWAKTKILKREPIELSKIESTAIEMYEGAHEFTKDWKRSVKLAFFASLYWVGDILCLYFAFRGLGYRINPGVLVFGYSTSTILSMISFIPAGIGIMEASLSLIFISFAVPSTVAVVAVLIYRLFAVWALIPVGGWSFVSLSKSNKESTLVTTIN